MRGSSFVVDMACFLNPYAVNSKVSDNCVNAGYHVWWNELTSPTLGGSSARASFFESSSFPHFPNYISILEFCMVCVGQNICGILWSHSSVVPNTSGISWTTHGTRKDARSTNIKQLQRKAVETLFRAIVNGWFESAHPCVEMLW